MGEMQSSRNFTSEFTRQTKSPKDCAMPMLFALAKPKFSGLRINLNSGYNSATSSGVPSVDALSTTITSEHTEAQCSRSDARHSRTYFLAFQTTITTDTRAVPAWVAGKDWGSVLEM